MGSKDNKTRKKWQDYSGAQAGKAEANFLKAFTEYFEGTSYQIRAKPIVDGPIIRTGATATINSVYVRDPDFNLIEISEILQN